MAWRVFNNMKKILFLFCIVFVFNISDVIADIISPEIAYSDAFYINKEGKKVFPPKDVNKIKKPKNETSLLKPAFFEENKKYGFKDKNNKWVIPPKFDYVMEFSENLSAVKENEKWGYINPEGNWVIKPKFSKILCPINTLEDRFLYFRSKCGNLSSAFHEGLAAIPLYEEREYYVEQDGNKKKYKAVLPENYEKTNRMHFVDGYIDGDNFIVKEIDSTKLEYFLRYTYKYGYINTKGDVVIRGDFYSPGVFSEGLAPVKIDYKFGYINTKGEVVIRPEYSAAYAFNNGIAFVRKYNPKLEKEARQKLIKKQKNINKSGINNRNTAYADDTDVKFHKSLNNNSKIPLISFSAILLLLIVWAGRLIKRKIKKDNEQQN